MTFSEWWGNYVCKQPGYVLDRKVKELVRQAWLTSMKIERDRCLDVCDIHRDKVTTRAQTPVEAINKLVNDLRYNIEGEEGDYGQD